jgi:hypothetical protein
MMWTGTKKLLCQAIDLAGRSPTATGLAERGGEVSP